MASDYQTKHISKNAKPLWENECLSITLYIHIIGTCCRSSEGILLQSISDNSKLKGDTDLLRGKCIIQDI